MGSVLFDPLPSPQNRKHTMHKQKIRSVRTREIRKENMFALRREPGRESRREISTSVTDLALAPPTMELHRHARLSQHLFQEQNLSQFITV